MTTCKDITPDRFKCSMSMACPGVFRSSDGKSYHITGNRVAYDMVTDKEETISISAELLESALCQANSSTSGDSSSLPSVALQSGSELEAERIAKLDALLNSDDDTPVRITPDGRVVPFDADASVTDSVGDVFADLGLDKEKSLIAMIQQRDASLLSAKERIQELTEALSLMIINANCVVGHWNEFGVEMDLANVMDILERQTRKISETLTQKLPLEEERSDDEVLPQPEQSPDTSIASSIRSRSGTEKTVLSAKLQVRDPSQGEAQP